MTSPNAISILVAEDDHNCRMLLTELLSTRAEFNAVFTSDGSEAWWHLSDTTSRFDLLIVDLNMAFVNGLDLIRRVRAQPNLASLPILICSGRNDRPAIDEASEFGITHYVLKPYLPRVMLERIEQALCIST